jgi:myosin heavy subunit
VQSMLLNMRLRSAHRATLAAAQKLDPPLLAPQNCARGSAMELAPRLDVWCQQLVKGSSENVYERGTIERLESHKAAAGSRLVSVKLKGGRQLDLKEELVLPANAEVQDGKADMTELRNLNEATLLHNMRVRYAKDDGGVYTSTGHILIAINPFRDLSIYGEKKVRV